MYNFCLKHFSLQEELSQMLLEMYTGLHVKHPLFLVYMNEFSGQISGWYANTNLHENSSRGSPVAQYGQDEANTRLFATLRKRLNKRNKATTRDYSTHTHILFQHRRDSKNLTFVWPCIIDMNNTN